MAGNAILIKYLIIYHKEDNDGLFSMAIIYDYLLSVLKLNVSDISLLGADYNILSEWSSKNSNMKNLHKQYENIIMTDISFNDPKYMKKLYKEYQNNFIWIDHHAPIIESSKKYGFNMCQGVRDTSKSAILCAYEFLYDTFNVKYNQVIRTSDNNFSTNLHTFPEFFRILSAWDSWSYEREGYPKDYVRDVNKGVTVHFNLDIKKILPVVHNIVECYNSESVSESGIYKQVELINLVFRLGNQINDYDDLTMENIIKESGDCSWKVITWDENGRSLARTACAIFHQGATNSIMFNSLIGKGIEQGLVFKHSKNGNWVLSMYNIHDNAEFHCGDFLKERYNGGGHKGAAGCTFTQDQFIEIVKKKEL